MQLDLGTYTQPVSRETHERIERFHDVLIKWQRRMNLIGSGTVDDIWRRHILDSWQVARVIAPGEHVLDMGSGGGLPALLIAARLSEAGNGSVTMVESNGKKVAFLRAALREMDLSSGTNIHVLNERVETALPQINDVTTVTARAFANLTELLFHCERLPNQPRRALFPKGRSFQSEIEEAEKLFRFDVTAIPSAVEPDSVMLECRNWVRKTG